MCPPPTPIITYTRNSNGSILPVRICNHFNHVCQLLLTISVCVYFKILYFYHFIVRIVFNRKHRIKITIPCIVSDTPPLAWIRTHTPPSIPPYSLPPFLSLPPPSPNHTPWSYCFIKILLFCQNAHDEDLMVPNDLDQTPPPFTPNHNSWPSHSYIIL